MSLLALPNGDLWIGFTYGISLLGNGHVRNYTARDGIAEGAGLNIPHNPLAAALEPPPREAEPRLGAVIAELGGTQFDNFESRFDGDSDLTSRALRRPNSRGPPSVEPMRLNQRDALLRFIEDMKAAAVEEELEGSLGRRAGKEIQRGEAAIEIAPVELRLGSSIASGATSMPWMSKPRSASQREFVPVPAPISSVRVGRARPEVTNSTRSGSGLPVSQGSSPEA